MTAVDYLAALASAALITLVANLVIREHLRETRAIQALLLADMRANDRAADIAADTLARVARERHEDDMWRRIQAAVDAAHFDITADQIRRLPEIQENDR